MRIVPTLVLAIVALLAGGQQKTRQQTDKPSAVSPSSSAAAADPWAVVSHVPQGELPKRRQSQHKREATEPLTADAFTQLIAGGKPMSLRECRKWISASVVLRDDAFYELPNAVYGLVETNLGLCVEQYSALTALDARNAALAIHRFDATELAIAQIHAKRQLADFGKQEASYKQDLEGATKTLTEVVSKYNALVTNYNQLNEANGQLFRTAQMLKLSYQQQVQIDCISSTSTAFQNGVVAARKLDQYTPPPQPTVCRTELVGWDLVTKCK